MDILVDGQWSSYVHLTAENQGCLLSVGKLALYGDIVMEKIKLVRHEYGGAVWAVDSDGYVWLPVNPTKVDTCDECDETHRELWLSISSYHLLCSLHIDFSIGSGKVPQ